MKNEVRIKPLLKYEVHYRTFEENGREILQIDTFTADEMGADPSMTTFFRTGHTIRVYFVKLEKVVISPVDDEDLPA
jgi:hypothetical protein